MTIFGQYVAHLHQQAMTGLWHRASSRLCSAFLLFNRCCANPILFLPGYRGERFELPESGIPVTREALSYLEPLEMQFYGAEPGRD